MSSTTPNTTPNLGLPYLMAAQAQKHVTHNEALRSLDAMVQLAVIDRTHATPPATPANGDRYIVASAPTGAWAGYVNQIAAWQDGGWQFYPPTTGWIAWIAAESLAVAWNGTSWVAVSTGLSSVNPTPLLGVNATADTTNRLAVASDASLFNHNGHGHQHKLNKATAADTASILYQDNYSGRAEIGLTGDDNLHFKVSADGTTWAEAIVINGATGAVSFPHTTVSGGAAANTVTLLIGAGESNEGGAAPNSSLSAAEQFPRACVQIFNNYNFNFESLRIGTDPFGSAASSMVPVWGNNLLGHIGLSDNATHGLENGLANTLDAGRWPQSDIYYLKTGQGGSTISQWSVGDASGYWTTFQRRYAAAKAILAGRGATIEPIIFYTQGINDALAGTPVATWQAATVAHFAKLRALVGATTPIIMTRFASPPFNAVDASYNAAMSSIAAADPFTFVIDTAGLTTNSDGNHLDYQGWLVLAERLADHLNGASGTLAPPTVSPAAGTYTGTQTVMLSGPSGTTIRYTLDGTPPTSHSPVYSAPLSIAATSTLQAVATRSGWANSPVMSAAYTIATAAAATPTITPSTGTYTTVQSVTLACATSGSTIHYTLDGTTPTAASAVYGAALAIATTTTVNAIAMASGYSTSAVASAVLTMQVPTVAPSFSVSAGSYSSAQTVALSSTTAGAVIHYTLDGSTPTTASATYSAPLTISATTTVKALASASGYVASSVASATYTIGLTQTATPTFSPVAGSYTTTQSVVLACATSGAAIYYTLDGSTPTTSSTVYASAIGVAASETIKAIAVASGYAASSVASAAYVIQPQAATPTFSVAAGTYSSAQSVTLSCATSGAAIYYTTDGSTPTTSSTVYASAIGVAASETIKAIAVASGYAASSVASAAYVISGAPSTTTATWTSMTGATNSASGTSNNYLACSGASAAGGVATQTIDATRAFSVTMLLESAAATEADVVWLSSNATAYTAWPPSDAGFVNGMYEYGGSANKVSAGGSTVGLGSITLAAAGTSQMRLIKSGNDLLQQVSTDGGTTWTTLVTISGALTGAGTLYVKALFAVPTTGKQVKVMITQ